MSPRIAEASGPLEAPRGRITRRAPVP